MNPSSDNSNIQQAENGRSSEMTSDPLVIIHNDGLPEVLKILKSRLPRSAHIYNMTIMASTFPSIRAYSLNGDLSENAIFVLIDIRQDFHQDINISVPVDFKISEKVKQDFIATSMINWNSRYWFPVLDRLISPMIIEISAIHKNNPTITIPYYYYIMSQEDAANLELKNEPDVDVQPLDAKEGAELIVKGWKFTRAGTEDYVQDIVQKGMTSGVYVDGIPVCGIMENKSGLLAMLYTAEGHRNKGYAKICTKHLLKQLGMKGFTVGSAVGCDNIASSEFHKKMGMTVSHLGDGIIYEKDNL